MKDREFLKWIHDRMEKVHNEDPLYDYMLRLRKIIKETPADKDTSGTANVAPEDLSKL